MGRVARVAGWGRGCSGGSGGVARRPPPHGSLAPRRAPRATCPQEPVPEVTVQRGKDGHLTLDGMRGGSNDFFSGGGSGGASGSAKLAGGWGTGAAAPQVPTCRGRPHLPPSKPPQTHAPSCHPCARAHPTQANRLAQLQAACLAVPRLPPPLPRIRAQAAPACWAPPRPPPRRPWTASRTPRPSHPLISRTRRRPATLSGRSR